MKRALVTLALVPGMARAHASDQAFVLLLPTDIYITAGVCVVAATVLGLLLIPDRAIIALFAHRSRVPRPIPQLATVTSLLSFVLLAALVGLGIAGPPDPLSNPLPLVFWTVGWVGVVSLSGIVGNLWTCLNPWTGLYHLLNPTWPQRPVPLHWGRIPATLLLVAFAAFLLADIAPDDPGRLATAVAIYWAVTMAGLLIAGPSWFDRVELGQAICGSYARLSARAPDGIGGPGWQLLRPALPASGWFALALLGAGSFDGLNETFWWLAMIGVNPLEFPGRSAVVTETLTGLAAALALLAIAFATFVWLGRRLVSPSTSFGTDFERLALSLLPIALVYHMAHYLPSFLVGLQYTAVALTDPLDTGADLLGIGSFHVTTGFFNRLDTVRPIWLTQAGLVVIGHVWSILLAHRIALDLYGTGRRTALATLPLSLFMVAYTFLGLWLLAAPRGA